MDAVAEEETVEAGDKSIEEMSLEDLQTLSDKLESEQTDEDSENNDDANSAASDEETGEPGVDGDSNDVTEGEDVASVLKAMEAMGKEMQGLQKLVARSQTELGLMRKANESSQGGEPEEEIDLYTDGKRYVSKAIKDAKADEAAEVFAQQNKMQDTKDYVEARVPKFESMTSEMSVELKDLLGDEPQAEAYAQEMKDRPYTFDPLVLLLAGRAAELRAKVNELEGKTKNSENSKSELIKKVNRLGRTKSVVKGSGGTSSGGGKVSYTNRQIENMSLEDLEKLDSQLRLDN